MRVLNSRGPFRAALPRMTTSMSVVTPSLNSPPPLRARLPRRTTSVRAKRAAVVANAAAALGAAAA